MLEEYILSIVEHKSKKFMLNIKVYLTINFLKVIIYNTQIHRVIYIIIKRIDRWKNILLFKESILLYNNK